MILKSTYTLRLRMKPNKQNELIHILLISNHVSNVTACKRSHFKGQCYFKCESE